jgi:hypothetical protein
MSKTYSQVVNGELAAMPTTGTIAREVAPRIVETVKAKSASVAAIKRLLAEGKLPLTSLEWCISEYHTKRRQAKKSHLTAGDFARYMTALSPADVVKAATVLGETDMTARRVSAVHNQQAARQANHTTLQESNRPLSDGDLAAREGQRAIETRKANFKKGFKAKEVSLTPELLALYNQPKKVITIK